MSLTHIYSDHISLLTRSEHYNSDRHLPALFAVIISTASVIGFILFCTTVWYVIRKIHSRKHEPKSAYGNIWVVTQPPNLPYGQPQTTQVGQPWTAPAEQSRAITTEQLQTTAATPQM